MTALVSELLAMTTLGQSAMLLSYMTISAGFLFAVFGRLCVWFRHAEGPVPRLALPEREIEAHLMKPPDRAGLQASS